MEHRVTLRRFHRSPNKRREKKRTINIRKMRTRKILGVA
jgi:hypothetical protein